MLALTAGSPIQRLNVTFSQLAVSHPLRLRWPAYIARTTLGHQRKPGDLRCLPPNHAGVAIDEVLAEETVWGTSWALADHLARSRLGRRNDWHNHALRLLRFRSHPEH